MGEYAVKHATFEGPLDLLLSLITERKLHINDISLSEVTDGYIAYVQQLESHPLAETAQFILVASTLLLIKSRSLLPSLELTDEEEGGIEELKERLAHYQQVRLAARAVGAQWGKRMLLSPRKSPYTRPIRFAPGELTLELVVHTATHLVRHLPIATFRPQAVVEKIISLEEMIDRMKTRLLSAVRTRFSDVSKNASRSEVVLQFLALLELVKNGFVQAEQERTFDDILLESQTVETPRYGV